MRNWKSATLMMLIMAACGSEVSAQSNQASVSAAPAAATGSTPGNSLFDLPLDQVLDIEVSTASKLKVKKNKSPGTLVTVTQDQIRRYGYRNVGEALQKVAGFLNSDVGAFTFLGYRGLSPQNSTANSRILVLVDGVRYNEWNFDQAALNERFPLDIESVDRIEVLKGAGSAIWGTNAVFAVINVISKSADSDRAQQVLYERRSNNRNKGYASWAGASEGGLKYFASASMTDENDDIAAYYPSFDTPPDSDGKVRDPFHQRGHHANVKLSYDDFYGNVAYSYNDYSLGSNVDYLFGDNGSAAYHDVPIRAELGYKSEVWEEQEGEFLARAYFTADQYRARSIFPNLDVEGNNFRQTNKFDTQARGAELRYSQNIFDNLTALVGTEWTRVYKNEFSQENGELIGNTELSSETSNEEILQTIQSYFYDLRYSPVDEVTLFFGGRLDRFSGLEDVFGPRASLVINPRDDTTVRFIYSKGLRNPSIGERDTASDNPEQVKHEDLDFYEAFVEHRFTDKITASTAVFYSDLSDTIEFVSFEDGNQKYANTAGLRSVGAEFDIRAQLDSSIESYGILTYAEASRKGAGAPVKSFPHTLARLGVSFGEKRDAFIISPELAFGSGTESTEGKEFDPFVVANLTVMSYPLASGLNISGSIYNIFDQDYLRLVGANQDDATSERAISAGREFRLQAKWDF